MKTRFTTLFTSFLLLTTLVVAQEPKKITPEEQLDILTTVLKVQQAQAEMNTLNAALNAKVDALREKYQCPDCIVNGIEGTLTPKPAPPKE